MRQNRVRDFCAPHPDDPTLYCLEEFSMLHHFSPGIFLNATRDPVGCGFRVLMEQCSARAIADGVAMLAGRAAARDFCNSAPPA
eukprot:6999517-Prymnesium_polylepis.1